MKSTTLCHLSILVLSILSAAACSAGRMQPPIAQDGGADRGRSLRPSGSKIQHVIFIVQENRSLNNIFMGFPGAVTQNYGYDTAGDKVVLHKQKLSEQWDIDHGSSAFFAACDGNPPGQNCKMDGWNNENACCGTIPQNYAYAYVPKGEVAPYWAMAKSYVLADNTFASNLDGSFVAHQYTIAAFASHTVDFPNTSWGCPDPGAVVPTLNADRSIGPNVPACLNNQTIGDEADRAGITWKNYAGAVSGDGGIWSPYQAIKHVYNGKDWTGNVISPPARFLTDISNGQLANITWVLPTFANSDHPGFSTTGPAWVASLVDAVGSSQFWDSSAIFVLWDDWGGWFDPVPPLYTDYDGLGFRIPLIVISPYAKKGYVTHVQYETSSVLRFIESTFGLKHLAPSDRRAADPSGDVFDFTKPPRKFAPFAGSKPDRFWLTQHEVLMSVQRPVGGD